MQHFIESFILQPPPCQHLETATVIYELFYSHHFINKIDDIRLHITPVTRNLSICTEPFVSMSHFE